MDALAICFQFALQSSVVPSCSLLPPGRGYCSRSRARRDPGSAPGRDAGLGRGKVVQAMSLGNTLLQGRPREGLGRQRSDPSAYPQASSSASGLGAVAMRLMEGSGSSPRTPPRRANAKLLPTPEPESEKAPTSEQSASLCEITLAALEEGSNLEEMSKQMKCSQIDGAVFDLKETSAPRLRAIEWFMSQFGQYGFRDEWLTQAVSYMDRTVAAAVARQRSKSRTDVRTVSSPSSDAASRQEELEGCAERAKQVLECKELWLAAVQIALKMSEAESELDSGIRDLISPMVSFGQAGLRMDEQRWKQILKGEFYLMNHLEYRLVTPSTFQFVDRVALTVMTAANPSAAESLWELEVDRVALTVMTAANRSAAERPGSPAAVWAGLELGHMPVLKGPPLRNKVQEIKRSSLALPARPVAKFQALCCFLAELVMVHKPADMYGNADQLDAMGLAVLQLALHSFRTPPPEACTEVLATVESRLLSPEVVAAGLVPMLVAKVYNLWSSTPAGSPVVEKWRQRDQQLGGSLKSWLLQAPSELPKELQQMSLFSTPQRRQPILQDPFTATPPTAPGATHVVASASRSSTCKPTSLLFEGDGAAKEPAVEQQQAAEAKEPAVEQQQVAEAKEPAVEQQQVAEAKGPADEQQQVSKIQAQKSEDQLASEAFALRIRLGDEDSDEVAEARGTAEPELEPTEASIFGSDSEAEASQTAPPLVAQGVDSQGQAPENPGTRHCNWPEEFQEDLSQPESESTPAPSTLLDSPSSSKDLGSPPLSTTPGTATGASKLVVAGVPVPGLTSAPTAVGGPCLSPEEAKGRAWNAFGRKHKAPRLAEKVTGSPGGLAGQLQAMEPSGPDPSSSISQSASSSSSATPASSSSAPARGPAAAAMATITAAVVGAPSGLLRRLSLDASRKSVRIAARPVRAPAGAAEMQQFGLAAASAKSWMVEQSRPSVEMKTSIGAVSSMGAKTVVAALAVPVPPRPVASAQQGLPSKYELRPSRDPDLLKKMRETAIAFVNKRGSQIRKVLLRQASGAARFV
ncbi:unnamed protein product [Polarella glacialis]|uniref:Uncharacterized protein n=1 Tax=Polarella glacialis TaxID=89957 RepID=A0A813KZX5_POLGL|nr:unnamed protein product [Polarella glacialis]